MKKFYLVFLVLVLFFIPTTNAVAVYQLDQPVSELNGHTLREVFEDGNEIVNSDFSDGSVGWLLTNASIVDGRGYIKNEIGQDAFIYQPVLIIGIKYYLTYDLEIIQGSMYTPFLTTASQGYSTSGVKSDLEIAFNTNMAFRRIVSYVVNEFYVDNVVLVNVEIFGIDYLTLEQMDKYYDLYLEAVRFEIENIEASQDPGGYQNIFKSVINGVKGLIVEMGNVWQFLNAPIITSEMSDYSFSIDWSWDLIGVVRQLINSLAILILQTNFIFINLLFSFTGIPVQISILSMIFSNFVFVILGWIIVKSFII